MVVKIWWGKLKEIDGIRQENTYINKVINICIGIIKFITSTFVQIFWVFLGFFFCILFQIYNLPDPMTYFICYTLTKAACVFIVKVTQEHVYLSIGTKCAIFIEDLP